MNAGKQKNTVASSGKAMGGVRPGGKKTPLAGGLFVIPNKTINNHIVGVKVLKTSGGGMLVSLLQSMFR